MLKDSLPDFPVVQRALADQLLLEDPESFKPHMSKY